MLENMRLYTIETYVFITAKMWGGSLVSFRNPAANGHLEKLTFSERANWIDGQPAGFVVRDKNGSARFLRSRRALSRSRCQEGRAGCPERGRALGGVLRSVERGLAQTGGGAEERGRMQALGRDRHLQDAGSAGALHSLGRPDRV